MSYADDVRRAAEHVRSRAPGLAPRLGLILGSGLAGAAPQIEGAVSIPYGEIPGFPTTGVPGHEGVLMLGRMGAACVAVLKGRLHYYEGHAMEAVAFPTRVLGTLGVETLVITAAVGATKPKMRPGHLVILKDHMNMMGCNPLRGSDAEAFGPLFPDLSAVYDPALRRLALKLARRNRFPVHEGVYAALSGPSYETPAEVRAYRLLGGDVVGMSVVPEAVCAKQMGMKVAAVTWVSNLAAGLSRVPPRHEEVLAIGLQISARLKKLIEDFLPRCA